MQPRKIEYRYGEPCWSRAGAISAADHYGVEANICVPLALDNALEDIDSSLRITDEFYEFVKGKWMQGWNFSRYLDMVGGEVHEVHGLDFEFQMELKNKRDNIAAWFIKTLRNILENANSKGRLCVLRLSYSHGEIGHILYTKLGKKDRSKVFFFDVVRFIDEPKASYSPIQFETTPEFNTALLSHIEEFDGCEVFEFTIHTQSPYIMNES